MFLLRGLGAIIDNGPSSLWCPQRGSGPPALAGARVVVQYKCSAARVPSGCIIVAMRCRSRASSFSLISWARSLSRGATAAPRGSWRPGAWAAKEASRDWAAELAYARGSWPEDRDWAAVTDARYGDAEYQGAEW